MTKTKHPKARNERLQLREKKNKEKAIGAVNKARRRAKETVREKEAENEVSLAFDNTQVDNR